MRAWSSTTPHDSYASLQKAEVAAIFDACSSPKKGIVFPTDPQRQELIFRSAKTLIGQLVFASMEQQKLEPDHAESIAKAYTRLAELMGKVPPLCAGAPPSMPFYWAGSMSEWSAFYGVKKNRLTGPAWFPPFAYPRIFGLFNAAYGKRPGQTLDGPGLRFTIMIFQAARNSAEASAAAGQMDKDALEMAARARQNLTVPTEAALMKKLPKFRSDSAWAEGVIERHKAQLETYDPWPTVE
jgi:hypothetical protein